MASFSPPTLVALVQIISGGPGLGNKEPTVGIYRAGPEIDGFLIGSASIRRMAPALGSRAESALGGPPSRRTTRGNRKGRRTCSTT